MSTHGGDIELVVRMRYSVVGLEVGGKPTNAKVLAALRGQEYGDIIDTEELEILKIEKLDLESEEDDS